ncbi:hypothetical protein FRC17_004584 [Serendipita sp. 399]|nr:hypothetical protein FRC17_004584 [Serendipita sp. 399]
MPIQPMSSQSPPAHAYADIPMSSLFADIPSIVHHRTSTIADDNTRACAGSASTQGKSIQFQESLTTYMGFLLPLESPFPFRVPLGMSSHYDDSTFVPQKATGGGVVGYHNPGDTPGTSEWLNSRDITQSHSSQYSTQHPRGRHAPTYDVHRNHEPYPTTNGKQTFVTDIYRSGFLTSKLSFPQFMACDPANAPIPQSVHSKKKGERSKIDISTLTTAFTSQSTHPDPQLRALLDTIPTTSFYLKQELEPRMDTPEAALILSKAGAPFLACNVRKDQSLLFLFVDPDENQCLFCLKPYPCPDRALGCVRKHLGHRPFSCGGGLVGCTKCPTTRLARFFTLRGMRDHINKQVNKDECPKCHARIRVGGIPRHFRKRHPSADMPDMKEERKRVRSAR